MQTEIPFIEQSAETSVHVAAKPQPLVLSDEQNAIIEEGTNGTGNIAVLGRAGTGKSTAVRALLDSLSSSGKNYAILAPTGVAALNVGGQTIHRFIGKLSNCRSIDLDVIVIDEVSMVRCDLLDELDLALQAATMNPLPFGGIRTILIGDVGQLPPVLRDGAEKENIDDNYLSPFFFSARSYFLGKFKILELAKIFRQKDQRYPAMLNLIRDGQAAKPVAWLNKFRRTIEPKGVILTATNKAADAINQQQMRNLAGTSQIFRAQIFGPFNPNEYPAEETIQIKVGCRVMVIKNIYRKDPDADEKAPALLDLVNGDVGQVTDMNENGIIIQCDRTGEEHSVFYQDGLWPKEDIVYDKETKKLHREQVGSFTQLPVRIAYAITIHKSQGATIEELTIDCRRPFFAAGQGYVAFSRGVSLERLWIMGQLRESDIIVDPAVSEFLHNPQTPKYVGIKPGSAFDMANIEPAAVAAGMNEEMFD